MTVLVTGGTGFLGGYVVDELVRQEIEVVSYNRDHSVPKHLGVTAVQGELFDLPRLVRALDEHGVDRIIHTAAQSHPGISIDLPISTFAANVDGTLALFEAARMCSAPVRIVNLSSECAYGDQDEAATVTESAPTLPNTPYGVTKVAGELLGRVYSSAYGLDIVSLRVTEIYGPGLKLPEVLKEMVAAAVRGIPFRLASGASHRFQFVHASDVARAVLLAMAKPHLPQYVYNVSGGEQVTVADVVTILRSLYPTCDLDVGPGHIDGWDRQGKFDISSAADDFGYQPQVGLIDGVKSYAAWLTDHPS
jgi:UDP-glucose 4-epimerase